MGYYINKDSKGNILPNRKVTALLNDGAAPIQEPKFQENLICVVQNVNFDAALYCYNEDEFRVALRDDGRNKIWLTHPLVKQLSE